MKLALRTQPASGRLIDKLAHWIIKARLVTQYPHAGIVISGRLYHATARDGITSNEYNQDSWVIVDIGGDDELALSVFAKMEGGRYDWFSLLAFVGIKARDSKAAYCYELCYHMRTGKHPVDRVTPETLIAFAARA